MECPHNLQIVCVFVCLCVCVCVFVCVCVCVCLVLVSFPLWGQNGHFFSPHEENSL